MEKLGIAGQMVTNAYNYASEKAVRVLLNAHAATGSTGNPFVRASKRLMVDSQAHSFAVFVDNEERLDQLKAVGLENKHVIAILVGHFFLDYGIPPLLIGAIYPTIHALTGLPPLTDLTISFFVGRAMYGIAVGTAREVMYSFLPKPNSAIS